MEKNIRYASDIAFTETVKAIQSRKGSRGAYARVEQRGSWETGLTPVLTEFIEQQISVFLGTASSDGQPYLQHRGGPPGFIKVIDDKTIGFVDFKGNRQYISQGNLSDNPKAILFLIDYSTRQRVKIWGRARVIEDDAHLVETLMPKGYEARPEQAILFDVTAWDANCSQHIPLRFEATDVEDLLAERDKQIKALEAKIEGIQRRDVSSS
jgi:uncharacterized protein